MPRQHPRVLRQPPWRSRLAGWLRGFAETLDPAPEGLVLDGAPDFWAERVRAAARRAGREGRTYRMRRWRFGDAEAPSASAAAPSGSAPAPSRDTVAPRAPAPGHPVGPAPVRDTGDTRDTRDTRSVPEPPRPAGPPRARGPHRHTGEPAAPLRPGSEEGAAPAAREPAAPVVRPRREDAGVWVRPRGLRRPDPPAPAVPVAQRPSQAAPAAPEPGAGFAPLVRPRSSAAPAVRPDARRTAGPPEVGRRPGDAAPLRESGTGSVAPQDLPGLPEQAAEPVRPRVWPSPEVAEQPASDATPLAVPPPVRPGPGQSVPDLPGVLPEHLWPPLPTRRAPAPVVPDPVPALERRVRLTAEQAAT